MIAYLCGASIANNNPYRFLNMVVRAVRAKCLVKAIVVSARRFKVISDYVRHGNSFSSFCFFIKSLKRRPLMTIPTEIQYRYMVFIDHYIRKFDNFPSMKIIAKSFVVNINAVRDHIVSLVKKGFLRQVPGRQCYQRTIKFKQYMASWPRGGNAK